MRRSQPLIDCACAQREPWNLAVKVFSRRHWCCLIRAFANYFYLILLLDAIKMARIKMVKFDGNAKNSAQSERHCSELLYSDLIQSRRCRCGQVDVINSMETFLWRSLRTFSIRPVEQNATRPNGPTRKGKKEVKSYDVMSGKSKYTNRDGKKVFFTSFDFLLFQLFPLLHALHGWRTEFFSPAERIINKFIRHLIRWQTKWEKKKFNPRPLFGIRSPLPSAFQRLYRSKCSGDMIAIKFVFNFSRNTRIGQLAIFWTRNSNSIIWAQNLTPFEVARR